MILVSLVLRKLDIIGYLLPPIWTWWLDIRFRSRWSQTLNDFRKTISETMRLLQLVALSQINAQATGNNLAGLSDFKCFSSFGNRHAETGHSRILAQTTKWNGPATEQCALWTAGTSEKCSSRNLCRSTTGESMLPWTRLELSTSQRSLLLWCPL